MLYSCGSHNNATQCQPVHEQDILGYHTIDHPKTLVIRHYSCSIIFLCMCYTSRPLESSFDTHFPLCDSVPRQRYYFGLNSNIITGVYVNEIKYCGKACKLFYYYNTCKSIIVFDCLRRILVIK